MEHVPFSPPLHDLPPSASLEAHDEMMHPIVCRILIACQILQFSIETQFTALVLLQRYATAIRVAVEGGDTVDWKFVSAACLFLASKQGEEHRRLRDMINLAHMVLDPKLLPPSGIPNMIVISDEPAAIVDEDKCKAIHIYVNPPTLDDAYWDNKAGLVAMEQMVLRWIGFDTSVSHPHRIVELILRCVDDDTITQNKMRDHAFQRINDTLFSVAALSRSALELGCAAVVLADESLTSTSNSNTPILQNDWWREYEVTEMGLSMAKLHLEKASERFK